MKNVVTCMQTNNITSRDLKVLSSKDEVSKLIVFP